MGAILSHQFEVGWFPECIKCHCGNVGPVVCLSPLCREAQAAEPVLLEKGVYVHGDLSVDEKLLEADGHNWKCCQLCDLKMLADPGAFGSYALCVKCFNDCIRLGIDPPTQPWASQCLEPIPSASGDTAVIPKDPAGTDCFALSGGGGWLAERRGKFLLAFILILILLAALKLTLATTL